MKDKCYIHVFRLERDSVDWFLERIDEIHIRCSQTGKMAKMGKNLLEICPVCHRPIFIQTDELHPKVRTVRQIYSKYLDRWLNIEEDG